VDPDPGEVQVLADDLAKGPVEGGTGRLALQQEFGSLARRLVQVHWDKNEEENFIEGQVRVDDPSSLKRRQWQMMQSVVQTDPRRRPTSRGRTLFEVEKCAQG
jgi:hypothetical protein